MSTFVWEVRTVTEPDAPITAEQIGQTIAGALASGPSDEEARRAWSQISSQAIVGTSGDDDTFSTLVEVDVFDADDDWAPAAISGFFDEEILDAFIALPGVVSAEHTDRISRPR